MRIGTSISEMILARLLDIPEWMHKAACADDDVYPFWDEGIRETQEVCKSCPVVQECEEYTDNISSESRSIDFGVFHGNDYGKG